MPSIYRFKGNIKDDETQLSLSMGNVLPLDLAYLAGLFDGEGCVRVEVNNRGVKQNRNQQYVIHIGFEISNTYEPIMKWLKGKFGGHVYETKVRGACSRTWSWRAYGDTAKWLSNLMIPYLIIKKDEMQILVKAINLKRGSNNRGNQAWYYTDMIKLKEITRNMRKDKHQCNQCNKEESKLG